MWDVCARVETHVGRLSVLVLRRTWSVYTRIAVMVWVVLLSSLLYDQGDIRLG